MKNKYKDTKSVLAPSSSNIHKIISYLNVSMAERTGVSSHPHQVRGEGSIPSSATMIT